MNNQHYSLKLHMRGDRSYSPWTVIYNAENRPLSFTSADGQSRIDCDCDYQDRRYMKKVSIQGSVISHERYLYRGYLQIAALDMLNSQALIRRILWDPKEPSATRPLALLQEGKLYSYGHDFLKNITELFDETNKIAITYDYSPYGAVTTSNATNTNNITQPCQWSSEIADPELALNYYNYRHYNPRDGRWINRDPIQEQGGWNLYAFVGNNSMSLFDSLGLDRYITQLDYFGLGGTDETNIHVGVAVDKWVKRGGKYVKNGIVTYDFFPVLTEETEFWGMTGNIVNLIATVVVAKGKVEPSFGLNLNSPITFVSSPCQDIEMLAKLKADEANPPVYNLVLYNCIIWSLNAIEYGMDKPGFGKCCNPDKTLFKFSF